MPIELSDAEDAALGKVLRNVPKFMRDTNDAHAALMRVFYAGLAVGIARAAKVCEDQVWDSDAGDAWHYAVERCVSAIRYLLK